MKKFIISFVLSTIQIVVLAQSVNVHFKNGQSISYPSGIVEYIDFSAKEADPSVTEGEEIDLGLSVNWASCNLGSISPEEYGYYYSWGETAPKELYLPSNYTFYDNDTQQYINIGDDISGTEYDAATVNLGNGWRMPTNNEMNELIQKCKWEWSQINGINGYLVTGSNGNSIFLPASEIGQEGSVLAYWTSTKSSELIVYTLNASSSGIGDEWPAMRYYGESIRPVKSR